MSVPRHAHVGWVLLAAACGSPGTAPTDGPGAAVGIEIELPVPRMQVGAPLQASARVVDAEGRQRTDRQVTWLSEDAGVASVDQFGVITGVAVGTARIVARSLELEAGHGQYRGCLETRTGRRTWSGILPEWLPRLDGKQHHGPPCVRRPGPLVRVDGQHRHRRHRSGLMWPPPTASNSTQWSRLPVTPRFWLRYRYHASLASALPTCCISMMRDLHPVGALRPPTRGGASCFILNATGRRRDRPPIRALGRLRPARGEQPVSPSAHPDRAVRPRGTAVIVVQTLDGQGILTDREDGDGRTGPAEPGDLPNEWNTSFVGAQPGPGSVEENRETVSRSRCYPVTRQRALSGLAATLLGDAGQFRARSPSAGASGRQKGLGGGGHSSIALAHTSGPIRLRVRPGATRTDILKDVTLGPPAPASTSPVRSPRATFLRLPLSENLPQGVLNGLTHCPTHVGGVISCGTGSR
ncbi:MAG: Ig-like domain-containing protein [Gemmatimonadales bacterium]|nr:Ig-like domain-containing protein [Gemmatimonadales bacterium]